MANHLEHARELAQTIRFSGDTLQAVSEGNAAHLAPIISSSYGNELRICPEVTPGLSNSLHKVCERLRIPDSVLHAFVFPTSDIQADCQAGTTAECVVRFSSGLIDILDEQEFEFVAGHEIGHFLLNHGLAKTGAQREALEFYMQSRYQEISVDRIGLVACRSLDVAVRTLMKTISGLNKAHLRFDVGTFISQLANSPNSTSSFSTHPSILVRCRALLWFSMSKRFTTGSYFQHSNDASRIDDRIMSDMRKYVDGEARRLIGCAKDELALWTATLKIVQRGSFSKSDQDRMRRMFGEETLTKLKLFLADISSTNAEQIIFEKVKDARNGLENLIPGNFEAELANLQDEISTHFSS